MIFKEILKNTSKIKQTMAFNHSSRLYKNSLQTTFIKNVLQNNVNF